jgi:hypothetical protein
MMILNTTQVFISSTTRGYEIAGNFRSHYTSICFDDNLSKKQIRVGCIRHDNSTKENFILEFYTIF